MMQLSLNTFLNKRKYCLVNLKPIILNKKVASSETINLLKIVLHLQKEYQ